MVTPNHRLRSLIDSNLFSSSRFSITFYDQDFNCDPEDHEGSVRRRCLQSRLHPSPEDRRTDAEFSLLTCKPSQFHPVGYEQMGMIQSMVSCVAGASVHSSSDGAEVAPFTQRSGQRQGKRSRPGGASDASCCKIPRYEWAGDDDFEKMYKMQVSLPWAPHTAGRLSLHLIRHCLHVVC